MNSHARIIIIITITAFIMAGLLDHSHLPYCIFYASLSGSRPPRGTGTKAGRIRVVVKLIYGSPLRSHAGNKPFLYVLP
jgi:hypothetical protein